LFTYFGFIGSHYNNSVGTVKSRLQNLKSQYQYAYWKVPTPELWYWWLLSSSAEVPGFLKYEVHI
jgi:hypothetical protein